MKEGLTLKCRGGRGRCLDSRKTRMTGIPERDCNWRNMFPSRFFTLYNFYTGMDTDARDKTDEDAYGTKLLALRFYFQTLIVISYPVIAPFDLEN